MAPLSNTPDSTHQLVRRDGKAWIRRVRWGRHAKWARLGSSRTGLGGPMSRLALAGGETKRKQEAAHSNQRRFGYMRRFKYHLVVMLGARIDVLEASIWHFNTYLPLPDKKTTKAVVKRDWLNNTNISNLILLTDVFAADLWWSVQSY